MRNGRAGLAFADRRQEPYRLRRAFRLLWILLCFSLSLSLRAESKGKISTRERSVIGCKTDRNKTNSTQVGSTHDVPGTRKINLVFRPAANENRKTILNQQTPTPPGWESYDGSVYTPERGYGWLTSLQGHGRDRGTQGIVLLADGTRTSPYNLRRPELANFQGIHGENQLLVFRIDLEDGWYRVSCASVDPDLTRHKPLVDQRSFKCRAHDVVFAGSQYGAPLVVGGRQLVEGSGVVEVTDGHLRIVVGDPAYTGWTWTYPGRWYTELKHWWRVEYNYSNGWYQWLSRTVDPGFHTLNLNSLEVRPVSAPEGQHALVFRDFFNRDDSLDVSSGVASAERWLQVKLHPRLPELRTELYKTSIKFSAPREGRGVGGFLQQQSES